MRYIVREGKVRGKGRYWHALGDRWIKGRPALTYSDRTIAGIDAKDLGGRVVRLLSHEEAKAKASAEALREAAADDRRTSETWVAEWLEERAEALWPARAGRRG
jgi:hypothetical protein